jgi:hypothetical protein
MQSLKPALPLIVLIAAGIGCGSAAPEISDDLGALAATESRSATLAEGTQIEFYVDGVDPFYYWQAWAIDPSILSIGTPLWEGQTLVVPAVATAAGETLLVISSSEAPESTTGESAIEVRWTAQSASS